MAVDTVQHHQYRHGMIFFNLALAQNQIHIWFMDYPISRFKNRYPAYKKINPHHCRNTSTRPSAIPGCPKGNVDCGTCLCVAWPTPVASSRYDLRIGTTNDVHCVEGQMPISLDFHQHFASEIVAKAKAMFAKMESLRIKCGWNAWEAWNMGRQFFCQWRIILTHMLRMFGTCLWVCTI